MWIPGSIRRRLMLSIVITALVPLIAALLLANSMVRQTSERFFIPEIGVRLDQSLGLYRELAHSVKATMRLEAQVIAADEGLRHATSRGDASAVRAELARLFGRYPDLVSLAAISQKGEAVAQIDRGRPVDEAKENELVVTERLSPPGQSSAHAPEDDEIEGPRLQATFATPRGRFDELESMSQFVDVYRSIEQRRTVDESAYLYAFAALLGLTILGATTVGLVMAGGVSVRIRQLAGATRKVGAGDLSIRVPEQGRDEVTALASAFNRMLSEVENNRTRIEYLQRMGAWQEMARRLAHEIKNPLTPIQLAVEEVHRRYPDGDQKYRHLLNSTLEIVVDEISTLRRLVSEFSGFARLPHAQLTPADLAAFLREQAQGSSSPGSGDPSQWGALPMDVELAIPDGPAPVYLDRQLLRRVMANLVSNASEALPPEQEQRGKLRISLSQADNRWVIDVDDNGPGIPEELRLSVFEPYVTTKSTGTGLGLAITKKIVMEHGGSIAALPSPLGGARIRLSLPVAGTPAGEAALEASRLTSNPPLAN